MTSCDIRSKALDNGTYLDIFRDCHGEPERYGPVSGTKKGGVLSQHKGGKSSCYEPRSYLSADELCAPGQSGYSFVNLVPVREIRGENDIAGGSAAGLDQVEIVI